MTCILADYRRDKCESCTKLCPHKIALHGLDGAGGRVGNAGLPSYYRHLTLANSPARESQPKIYEQLEKYVATFERMHGDSGDSKPIKSLYLWSESPGTGKTTTAIALLNEWIAQDYLGSLRRGKQPRQLSAYFLDVNAWQTDYNNFNRKKVPDVIAEPAAARYYKSMERAKHAPFAVLDDIGVRDCSEGFRGDLHAVINYRVTNGKPTIYTSNLPMVSSVSENKKIPANKPYDLIDVFNEKTARLVDRMKDQCGVFHFSGGSKRGRR